MNAWSKRMEHAILIDGIRVARRAISARFGHDPKALIEHCRQFQKKYAHRLLCEEPERVLPDAGKTDEGP